MLKLAAVAAGGAVGALARYLVSGWALRALDSTFPYGTLAVNLIGCFLIGLITATLEGRVWLPGELRLFLVVGLLGGLTTFSAFGYETVELAGSAVDAALLNVAASVVLGVLLVIAGRTAAGLLGL